MPYINAGSALTNPDNNLTCTSCFVVDSLVMYAGERFDIVLHADQPVDNYWMRFTGLLNCNTTKAHTLVHINYVGADCIDPTTPVGYNVHHAPKLVRSQISLNRFIAII